MCTVCGCSGVSNTETANNKHNHEHDKNKEANNVHDYSQGEAGQHIGGIRQDKIVEIEYDILSKNNIYANKNRSLFLERSVLALNLVSSPGSGKTSILEKTLIALKDKIPLQVIEGDQQTTQDAQRVKKTGVEVIQINTGKGCHLDAHMVMHACKDMQLESKSILFIENVGNLVCPAPFDLGEYAKVAILSVTEGEDKPLKYPDMFAASDLLLINKIDLLPYLKFDIGECVEYARKVNPKIQVLELSSYTGEGMDKWHSWLEAQLKTLSLLKR